MKELKKACDDQKDISDKQNEALGKVAEKLDKLINNTTKGLQLRDNGTGVDATVKFAEKNPELPLEKLYDYTYVKKPTA